MLLLSKIQNPNLLKYPQGFGGCFSGFAINTKQYETDSSVVVLDVANTNMDGCPPYHDATFTCQDSLITQVYLGQERMAFDTGLLPYTGEEVYIKGLLMTKAELSYLI